ncbi:hypothetical protein ACWCOW_29860 [Streptomyces sp. NPDC001939]
MWAKWKVTAGARIRGGAGDSGAGFVEYAGLMILIGGIFVLIDQVGLDGLIAEAIANAVRLVTGD